MLVVFTQTMPGPPPGACARDAAHVEFCGALACAGEGFCAGAEAGIGVVVAVGVGDGEVCRGVLAGDVGAGGAPDSAYQVWTPLWPLQAPAFFAAVE